jgi:hypothetical protein
MRLEVEEHGRPDLFMTTAQRSTAQHPATTLPVGLSVLRFAMRHPTPPWAADTDHGFWPKFARL